MSRAKAIAGLKKIATEYLKKDKTGASRAGKIAKSVVGATDKGRRTGEAVRNKKGQVSGLKPQDIKTARNIRRGAVVAGVAGAAAAMGREEKGGKAQEASTKKVEDTTMPTRKGKEVLTSYTPAKTKYTVKKGDTLSEIAKKNNTTIAAIKEANKKNITDIHKIKAGQIIVIPDDVKRKNPYKGTKQSEMQNTNKKACGGSVHKKVGGGSVRGCGAALRGLGNGYKKEDM